MFPPSPRWFDVKVNKKAYRSALRSALSSHARERDARASSTRPRSTRRRRRTAAGLLAEWGKDRPLVVIVSPEQENVSSRSATSTACSSSSRPRSRSPRSCGPARCSSPRTRSSCSQRRAHEPAPERDRHLAGGLGEELRRDRERQVLVPRAPGRAQDAGPAGGRGAVRRQGRCRQHHQGAPEAEAPRPDQGHAPRLEEGNRQAPPGPGRSRSSGRRTSRCACQSASSSRRARAAASCRVSTFEEVTKKEPEKSLLEPRQEDRRPQQQRPHHDAPPRRRPQAPLPRHRLQAPEGRRAGEGRRDRVRPEPVGPHRAAPLRRRREGLHPRARAARGRRDGRVRPRGRHQARQRAAAREHPDRHARSTTSS